MLPSPEAPNIEAPAAAGVPGVAGFAVVVEPKSPPAGAVVAVLGAAGEPVAAGFPNRPPVAGALEAGAADAGVSPGLVAGAGPPNNEVVGAAAAGAAEEVDVAGATLNRPPNSAADEAAGDAGAAD